MDLIFKELDTLFFWVNLLRETLISWVNFFQKSAFWLKYPAETPLFWVNFIFIPM